MVKLANTLLVLALLVLVTAAVALFVVAGMEGWGDLADALAYLLQARWLGLVLLLLALCGFATGLGWARRRDQGPADLEARRASTVERARQRLQRVIAAREADVGEVIDALLGQAVAHDAGILLRAEGGSGEILLVQEGEPTPLMKIDQQLQQRLVQRLREMTGTDEDEENGLLEFRSFREQNTVLVRFRSGEVRLAALRTGEQLDQAVPPRKRRRRISVVFRIEEPVRDIRTGEIALPRLSAEDSTDPGSGLLGLSDLAGVGEPEDEELAPRKVGALEASFRLAFSAALLALLLVAFGESYSWALCRLRGGSCAPWREIELRVTSSPSGALVRIGQQQVGRTPLSRRVPCRGRDVQVLVEAPGYSTWQWSGLCPARGPLLLKAYPKPLK